MSDLSWVNKVLVVVRRICGIGEIHQTDHGRTYQINKKNRFVRTIIVNEFFNCFHKKNETPFVCKNLS